MGQFRLNLAMSIWISVLFFIGLMNLKTYADALKSWDYDPEVGSIDTVYGASDRFGKNLDGVGWEVAFTPILPDGTFLSKDTVEKYFEEILRQAYADDGQVTDDELKKLDAQGMKIGNTFVRGIYAGVDASLSKDETGMIIKPILLVVLCIFQESLEPYRLQRQY